MAGREPEEVVARPVVRQRWQSLAFLHWPYDPADVQPLLPSGLEPDTWDGAAWVGLTPFLMADFRLLGLPPAGRLSTFPETNVRTYVRDARGRDGLWFLSLDADSLPTVLAASAAYGVPYRWAGMSIDEGPPVRYRSHRRVGRAAGHDIVVRPDRPHGDGEASAFDHWLTGRWRAYTTPAGRLAVVPVAHEPWPLWRAELVSLEETTVAAAGLPAPVGAPLVHWSPGVDVRLGRPHAA
ncbi:MAG: YqjF family protein [Acidimicrobiales bacterium]